MACVNKYIGTFASRFYTHWEIKKIKEEHMRPQIPNSS